MKSYLGLDLSYTATGFFLLREDGSYKQCEICTKPKDFPSTIRRARYIANQILELLKDEKPELILLEDYYVSRFAAQGLLLATLGTMVRDRILTYGLPYITVPPARIKKFETGSGSAGKELMLKSVFKTHNVDVNSNNVADACAMAHLCKAWYEFKNGNQDFKKYQLEVLKKMDMEIEKPYSETE